jgi:hypothetical protein
MKPTIGRVLWYQPPKPEDCPLLDQPLSASVAYVHDGRTINIGYWDSDGTPRAAQYVTLLGDGEAAPATGNYCEWMPYQRDAAAKAEVEPKTKK